MEAKRLRADVGADLSVSCSRTVLRTASVAIFVAMATAGPVSAADDIRLGKDVVPAPFGYDSVTTKYVIAQTTPLYVNPFIYPGTVNNNKMKAGQPVNVLAKAKDYDWILVGQNGVGIGYIPISRLKAAP